jgi:regulator of protease activity HflC (stomatin/prohibitin superfamily)
MFIFAIILFIIGIVVFVVSRTVKLQTDGGGRGGSSNSGLQKRVLAAVGILLVAISLVLGFFASFFTQDVGQSSVLKDWTGKIVGSEATPGFHLKAPWVEPVTFDVRNQRVVYAGASGNQSDNSGGQADGAQITVQDKDGVTSDIDIAIRYSLNPGSVVDIYSQYQNEENLRTRLIFNDIRSVVRSIPGNFSTLDLLTKRDEVQKAIFDKLTEKWADDGILVEDVALQEVRPPEAVKKAYAEAQQAQVNVSAEQAKLDAAKVSAQQKVVQAQAEADANQILARSLTQNILQQRYLDTLGKLAEAGNLVVVPEGFNGLVNVTK